MSEWGGIVAKLRGWWADPSSPTPASPPNPGRPTREERLREVRFFYSATPPSDAATPGYAYVATCPHGTSAYDNSAREWVCWNYPIHGDPEATVHSMVPTAVLGIVRPYGSWSTS